MDNNKQRPVYLNLFLIRLPVAGVVSILHRVSGIVLVLFLPLALLALQQSLQGAAAYQAVADTLSSMPVRLLLVWLAAVFAHHFLAGLRHLLLDIDIGIRRRHARLSAWWVLAGVVIVAVFVGLGLL